MKINDIFHNIDYNVCWNWTKSLNTKGYGRIFIDGRSTVAHVIVYEYFNGSVPEGLELDHLCRNKSCVRPSHLEAVTHQVNCQRGDGGGHHCRKISDDPNKVWCGGHKDFIPKIKFSKNVSRWTGLASECKKCTKIRQQYTGGKGRS